MLYLLFAHPQQTKANKLTELIMQLLFPHIDEKLKDCKQFMAFGVNIAILIMIITEKE